MKEKQEKKLKIIRYCKRNKKAKNKIHFFSIYVYVLMSETDTETAFKKYSDTKQKNNRETHHIYMRHTHIHIQTNK